MTEFQGVQGSILPCSIFVSCLMWNTEDVFSRYEDGTGFEGIEYPLESRIGTLNPSSQIKQILTGKSGSFFYLRSHSIVLWVFPRVSPLFTTLLKFALLPPNPHCRWKHLIHLNLLSSLQKLVTEVTEQSIPHFLDYPQKQSRFTRSICLQPQSQRLGNWSL